MVLFDWPTREKIEQKIRAEIAAEAAFEDWLRRRDEARDRGEEFDELPPWKQDKDDKVA